MLVVSYTYDIKKTMQTSKLKLFDASEKIIFGSVYTKSFI